MNAAKVKTKYSDKFVEVLGSHGPFVVHKRIDIVWSESGSSDFALTHEATGHAVSFRFPSVDKALAAAAAIEPLADWSFTDPETVKAWPKEKVKAIQDVVRAHAPNTAFRL